MREVELTPLNYHSVRDLKMGHAEWAVCPMATEGKTGNRKPQTGESEIRNVQWRADAKPESRKSAVLSRPERARNRDACCRA